MNKTSRFLAVVNYLVPIIGWFYVFFFHRKNSAAMYHMRQSIGLVLFLIAVTAGWAVVAWFLAWIPYMAVLGIALFTIVIAAYFYGLAVWIFGLINALSDRQTPLPLFGQQANRLPIK